MHIAGCYTGRNQSLRIYGLLKTVASPSRYLIPVTTDDDNKSEI